MVDALDEALCLPRFVELVKVPVESIIRFLFMAGLVSKGNVFAIVETSISPSSSVMALFSKYFASLASWPFFFFRFRTFLGLAFVSVKRKANVMIV